jgi:hypothetical protein
MIVRDPERLLNHTNIGRVLHLFVDALPSPLPLDWDTKEIPIKSGAKCLFIISELFSLSLQVCQHLSKRLNPIPMLSSNVLF